MPSFYNGGSREKDILWRAYLRLIKHINSIYKVLSTCRVSVTFLRCIYQIRIAYEWTEDYVIKYLWSAAGYALIAIPVLLTRRRHVGVQTHLSDTASRVNDEVANRTESEGIQSIDCPTFELNTLPAYISSRRLLLSLADAGGRLMYAYKDLLELAGLTTRLYTLLSTLHNLTPLPKPIPSESVELSDVDVAVPSSASTVLVKELSLSLKPGEHLMITGSNGVGKTAVARVLAGLWAPYRDESTLPTGEVRRPEGKKGVFVVPQRSYMVSGRCLISKLLCRPVDGLFIPYPGSYTHILSPNLKNLGGLLRSSSISSLPSTLPTCPHERVVGQLGKSGVMF